MLEGLKQFGKSDDLYKLLEEYPIRPWESWTIEEKIIHAPGTNTSPKVDTPLVLYYEFRSMVDI